MVARAAFDWLVGKGLDAVPFSKVGGALMFSEIPLTEIVGFGLIGLSAYLFYRGRKARQAAAADHAEREASVDINRPAVGTAGPPFASDRIPFADALPVASERGWLERENGSTRIFDFIVGLRQAAMDGTVAFWGRYDEWGSKSPRGPLVPIPTDHWRDYEIEILPLLVKVQNHVHHTKKEATALRENDRAGSYCDLHVSRSQFMRWLESDANSYIGAHALRNRT